MGGRLGKCLKDAIARLLAAREPMCRKQRSVRVTIRFTSHDDEVRICITCHRTADAKRGEIIRRRRREVKLRCKTRVKIQLEANAPLTPFGQYFTADAYSVRIAIYLYLHNVFANGVLPPKCYPSRLSIVRRIWSDNIRYTLLRPIIGVHSLEGLLHLVIPVAPCNNRPLAESNQVESDALPDP
jgi:hypothetical protein